MSYLLVIGATSDIAKATAREYASHGFDLYLACRSPDDMTGFVQDLKIRSGRNTQSLALDILDYDSHKGFYDALEEKPAGILVAAGYLGEQATAQYDFDEVARIINTNYTGIVNLLNIIANDFEARGHGFIIGISSVAGDRGRQSNYLYGSAKSGLSTYLSGLRNRLNNKGVQVLTVKPGFVSTRMTANMDLPGPLTTQPGEVAEHIYKAQQSGKDVIYTKRIWRWIMLIIRAIPEWLFKRTNI